MKRMVFALLFLTAGHAVALADSLNVRTVGLYNTSGSANDVVVSGNYAYVADGYSGLRIINISNPSAPVEIGSYNTSGNARGLGVSGIYAYIADDNDGLRIINISDPANPTETGFYDTPGRAYGVTLSGSYAYVADGSSGLRIINISNPASPSETGYLDLMDWAFSAAISGNYAYVAEGSSGLRIINISNPASPFEAGCYDTPGYSNSVALLDSFAYVADSDSGLRIINISNPASPVEVAAYASSYACDVSLSVNYAYLADYIGLQIIDISNPIAPIQEGYYDTPGSATGIFFSGHNIYVADNGAGLRILNEFLAVNYGTKPTIDGTLSPGEWQDAALKAFATSGGPDSIWIKHFGDTLYAAVRNPNYATDSYNWILLDVNYDRAALPQTDDKMLYCLSDGWTWEKTGTGTGWPGSPGVQTGWQASSTAGSDYWISEWKIAYSKLGLTQGVSDIFGISLDNYIGGVGYFWPYGSYYTNPSSWKGISSVSNWGMPEAALNLSSYDFGPVYAGDSAVCSSIYLKNTGSYALTVSGLDVTSGPFTLLNSVPFNVAANDSQAVIIKFKPGQFVSYTDTLTVSTNDPAIPARQCVLSGTGAEPPAVVDVPFGAKPAFDGVLSAGEWSDAVFITPHQTALNDTVWLKYNIDTLYAGFKGSDSVANNQHQLYFDNNYDRATMPIGDDHRLRIQLDGYISEGVGDGSGWITATVAGWNVVRTSVPGKWFSEWKVALSKLDITPGQPDSLGMAALVYSFVSGGNSWPSTFFWENPSTWGLMKSSQKWGLAAISANDSQHDFGYIKPDDSLSWTSLYLKNTGSLDLDIDSLLLGSGNFRVDPPTDSLLAPGDSLAVAVWFKPNSSGAYRDTLRIYSNDPVNNPGRISLAGNGAYIIDVPWGTMPKFEGTIDPAEWADACCDSFLLEDQAKKYHNVDSFWVKYNTDTLYLALITPNYADYKITSHSLIFDLKFDRTSTVQDDDHRFLVVSDGEPVEFVGLAGVWDKVTPAGWRSDFSNKDHLITFYAVPFDRLGLSIGANDTIGFAVLADGDGGIYGRWPMASDSVGPATWGILTSSAGWTGVMGKPDDQTQIRSFSLANAYPNPAGKQVNLSYQLPAPANVRLNIYNIAGQMVKCFDQGRQSAGAYSIRYNTAALPNGVYFYQIDAGAFKATKRMMVIR